MPKCNCTASRAKSASRVQHHAFACPQVWGYRLEQPKNSDYGNTCWELQPVLGSCSSFKDVPATLQLLLQPVLHCNVKSSGFHTSLFFFFYPECARKWVHFSRIILHWKASARMLKKVDKPDLYFLFWKPFRLLDKYNIFLTYMSIFIYALYILIYGLCRFNIIKICVLCNKE